MMDSDAFRLFIRGLFPAVLFLVSGCGKSPPAEFRLNMPELVKEGRELTHVQQQGVADALSAIFGTPDKPIAPEGTELSQHKLDMAAGPVLSDREGAKHGLYRRHCAHCHGVSGDGRGPTAMILNPYPRDYRPGLFKFKSTTRESKPTTDDLHRVLVDGIPGTAMPSFALLRADELDALVEYVKYLSMRGQTEIALAGYAYDDLVDDDDNPLPFDLANSTDQQDALTEIIADVASGWLEASENKIQPESDSLPPTDRSKEELAASIKAGQKLFFGADANCVKCHGQLAMGDGQTDDWNDWNKATKEFVEETATLVGAENDDEEEDASPEEIATRQANIADHLAVTETLFPVRKIQPRNLRQGVYRGGRRPLDIFWRIHEGVNGTPMPGSGSALTQEQIWQIVDYVLSLPYEPASRPQKKLTGADRDRM